MNFLVLAVRKGMGLVPYTYIAQETVVTILTLIQQQIVAAWWFNFFSNFITECL